MVWTRLTRQAYEFAFCAHGDQKDKGGAPYINHLLAVAQEMPDEVSAAVALLHDIIEDTPTTAEYLAQRFPMEVVASVCALTRWPDTGMSYMDYIRSIKHNQMAVMVKKADLRHNMDLSRLGREPTEQDISLIKRYEKALAILEEPPAWEVPTESWTVVAEDGNGKIHIFHRNTDDDQGFVADARKNPGTDITAVLAVYRDADVVEDAKI